jgi:outer membrane protein assembly factor BamB
MDRLILAFVLLSFSAAGAADYEGSDWPHWLGPARDSISREVGWRAQWEGEPPIAWTAKVGTGFSAIVVADGRAYVMGNANRPDRGSYYDTVWCLDALTGRTIWEHSYPGRLVNRMHEGGPSSTPALHDGKLYTLGKVGQIYCLDAMSGSVVWEADLGKLLDIEVPEWGFTSSPLIDADHVMFQAGATIALNRHDGRVVWTSTPRKPAYGTPAPLVVGGRKMLASLNSDGLSMIDASSGREIGFHEWETSYDTNATTPIISGDTVFVSTGYHKGCALLKVEPTGALSLVYRNDRRGQTMSNHFNNSVLIDGHLYGFDGNSHQSRTVALVCMELSSGKEKWRQLGYGCGSLIGSVAPGQAKNEATLIILSEDGRLVTARATPSGFRPISQAQVLGGKCWTMPTLSHGRLYARNARGDVVCVDLRPAAR